MVILIASVGLTIAGAAFARYLSTTAGRRAAEIFARDLSLARTAAVRSREEVVIRFYEGSMRYTVTTVEGERNLVRRRFGAGGDINLSSVDLELSGDSLRFSSRGVADLSGVAGLGTAAFAAGNTVYEVAFNAMGASRISER